MREESSKCRHFWCWGILLALALPRCASLGLSEDPEDLKKPTHYSLRLGDKVINTPPLPSYTPVLIDWHFRSGAVISRLGFKGWDFNNDGRFDLLQAVLSDGSLGDAVFDFDFDGVIDFRQSAENVKASPSASNSH